MIIKRLYGVLLILFMTAYSAANAQSDTTEIETLFGKKDLNARAFGTAQFSVSSLDGTSVTLVGAGGGILLRHNLAIGIDATGVIHSGVAEDIYYDRYDDVTTAVLRGIYGGVKITPILNSKKLAHIGFPVAIGGGLMMYKTERKFYSYTDKKNYRREIDSDNFFYIEPGALMEFNISRFMRFGIFISYRITSGLKLNSTPGKAYNSITTGINLSFGKL